jgi:two-component system, cell cycle sensor histidine kinase and response regulator CckA
MAEPNNRAPRVLIVDDEDSIRTFAARALREAGYDVVVASDGPDALAVVEQSGSFDLYVIDLLMPQMRGDEVARRLRRADPGVKILYFTGYSDSLFSEKKMLWQNEAFVEKPVSLNGLLEAASLSLFGHTRGLDK